MHGMQGQGVVWPATGCPVAVSATLPSGALNLSGEELVLRERGTGSLLRTLDGIFLIWTLWLWADPLDLRYL